MQILCLDLEHKNSGGERQTILMISMINNANYHIHFLKDASSIMHCERETKMLKFDISLFSKKEFKVLIKLKKMFVHVHFSWSVVYSTFQHEQEEAIHNAS